MAPEVLTPTDLRQYLLRQWRRAVQYSVLRPSMQPPSISQTPSSPAMPQEALTPILFLRISFLGSGAGLFNIPPAAINATPINIANTVVARDADGSFSAGSISGSSANFSGAATPSNSVLAVNDTGNQGFSFSVNSANNPAALFISSGPTVFMAGKITGATTVLSSNGDLTLNGTATAHAFSGDGSALTNVSSTKIGSLSQADIATVAALNAETASRQTADTAIQASIAAETSARQSDVSNLQASINNVSAADAKLAASNTFTAGTQDFSGATATLPVRAILSANTPAACVASKELLIKTDAPAGQQLFICNSTANGWILIGGSANGVLSFNGRNGSVSPATGDYSFAQISGTATASQLPSSVVYNNQANSFTGNQTVNGAVTATSFSGSGSALTGVNAATLNGLASGSFAQLGAANTFSAKQTMAASTTTSASLNVPSGTAPASPAAGDVWNTGSTLQYRDNASTTRSLVSTTQSGGLQLLKAHRLHHPANVSSQGCTEQSFTVSGISTGDVLLSVLQPSTSSPGDEYCHWRVPCFRRQYSGGPVLQRQPEQQLADRRRLYLCLNEVTTRPELKARSIAGRSFCGLLFYRSWISLGDTL